MTDLVFGRLRPDHVVWLFDVSAGSHLLLHPDGRGSWLIRNAAGIALGSVYAGMGAVHVHVLEPAPVDGK